MRARNSGVIHAGSITTKSIKAKVCCDGRHKLYEYAATKDIHLKNREAYSGLKKTNSISLSHCMKMEKPLESH